MRDNKILVSRPDYLGLGLETSRQMSQEVKYGGCHTSHICVLQLINFRYVLLMKTCLQLSSWKPGYLILTLSRIEKIFNCEYRINFSNDSVSVYVCFQAPVKKLQSVSAGARMIASDAVLVTIQFVRYAKLT